MKHPTSHQKYLEEIEQIVKQWPVEKDFDDVIKWVMQFDPYDIDIAIRIIKNINVIGFEDLNTSLSIAFSKLERVAIDKNSKISPKNTLFAGIGDGAKSGAMIGYNFRIVNELPEDNFMNDSSITHLEKGVIENIVLIDDIIGTGNQASAEIKQLTEKFTPFGVKNIFLLTAVGMSDGIKKIYEETKANVFSAFEYSSLDTVANLDSNFYEGIAHEKRIEVRSRIEYYGKVSNRSGLGYGGVGALIAFYYNTPNISLPAIWGSQNSWIPLFRRATKINGIASYYKNLDSSIKKLKKENAPIQGKENELIVMVEGRIDESFYEYVFSAIGELPFEKINIISMGGHGTKTLVENIQRLSPNCLFIIGLDKTTPSPVRKRQISHFLDSNATYIELEEVEDLIDLEKLRLDEGWGKIINRIESKPQTFIETDIRIEIRRRLIMFNMLRTEFYRSFLNENSLNNLISALREKILGMANK